MNADAKSRSFRDVDVWVKGHAWVLAVYRFSSDFPRSEMYGLTSQLRRAAVSVVTNFTEGFRRRTKADKARYYNIAQASLDEATYCLILAQDLGYGVPNGMIESAEEVSRMLDGYTMSMLRKHSASEHIVSGAY